MTAETWRVGDRVRIERDETRYPSKGTWPWFRGRTGTVVEINVDRQRPHLTEHGVALGKVSARTDGRGAFNWDAASLAWFKSYEMVRVGAVGHADGHEDITGGEDTSGDIDRFVRVDDETKTILLMALATSQCADRRQEARDVLRDLGST